MQEGHLHQFESDIRDSQILTKLRSVEKILSFFTIFIFASLSLVLNTPGIIHMTIVALLFSLTHFWILIGGVEV
jgi:hypothetical protein